MSNCALTCEACHEQPATVTFCEAEQDRPYQLCPECLTRLQAHALRPLEWFNLTAIHGWTQFSLHDDFYLEDGTALQPATDVESPERWPAPTLAEVQADLPRLIDYCLTRWRIDDDTAASLRSHSEESILAELRHRTPEAAPLNRIQICLTISSLALGPIAADWVRAQLARLDPAGLGNWVQAACRSLPREEAFDRTTTALAQCPVDELTYAALALGEFRSARTLDWIEQTLPASGLPVSDSWGRLAAISELSWPRIRNWLAAGRPLSLVALDALTACFRYDTPVLRRYQPKLAEPPTLAAATAVFDDLQSRDDAWRVKSTIPRIRTHWQEIVG